MTVVNYYITPKNFFIYDWEDFDESQLKQYLDQGYSLFLQKVKQLKQSDKPITEKERKELMFMLEALIDTQQLNN